MCGCSQNNKVAFQQNISRLGSLPYISFSYCAYPTQMTNIFNKIGVKANKDTLAILAKLADNGGDLRGDLGGIKFSVMDTLKKIDITQAPESNMCAVS